jgi:hypothetical protein
MRHSATPAAAHPGGAGETANQIVVSNALQLLEGLAGESADLVFLNEMYHTGGMGALAFSPESAGELIKHLEMVSQLLQQSKRVLRSKGTLFVLTDAFSASHYRMVADRVFGAERFATQIIVPPSHVRYSDQWWPDYGVLLVYTKSDAGTLHALTRLWTPEEARTRFAHSDAHGPYELLDLTRPASRDGLDYTWPIMDLPEGRTWRYPPETMDQLALDGRIVLHGEPGIPALKTYMTEAPVTWVGSVWSDMADALQREVEVWPEEDVMLAFVRYPLDLMDRIIEIGSDPGDRIVAPRDAAASVAVSASRLGRRWTIGTNLPSLARGAADRLARYGYPPGTFELVGREEAKERFPTVQQAYQDFLTGLVPERPPTFVLGEPVPFEESLHVEFKEVTGARARDLIKATADEYAVGFLNREGGRILWGIRDRDGATTGVRLDAQGRDDIRKLIVDQLAGVDPPPAPNQYEIYFHRVVQPEGGDPDLRVVELRVSRGDPGELYCTGKGKYFMKSESGNKQLTGRAQKDEILRRALALQPKR